MQDRTPTDLHRPIVISYPEISQWCAHLGCTEVQLAEAIGMVGHSPGLVAEYLRRQAAIRPAEHEALGGISHDSV